MHRVQIFGAVGLLLFAEAVGFAGGESVVLNDPAFPSFHSTSLDHPRLYGLLTDGGVIMEDENGPVLFRAFIDTGSSGFVLSNLHATGSHDTPSYGLTEDDYIGVYTNTGIGGEEVGSVTRPFGVLLYNDPLPVDGDLKEEDFVNFGESHLWVRDQPGTGEVVEIDIGGGFIYPLVSPINIVGMPVIRQRVMLMEWIDIPPELEGLLPPEAKSIQTKLLPPGHPDLPATNVTLDMEMRDFVGEAPSGETLPTMSRNPMVKNVTISHDPGFPGVTADWLFDTGAGSSFISFSWAKQIGLIPQSYQNLESFVIDHAAGGGMTSQIGGIGADAVTVPILMLNEIRVPAREGFDLVWENVRILVFDHPELAALGLEGIFGMNLIGPAATIDSSKLGNVSLGDDELLLLLLLALSDISPTPFESIQFEVTGETTGELRLFTDRVAAPVSTFGSWRETNFSAEDAADPAVSGPEADPDGDGLPNLLEYAVGGVPGEASRAGMPEHSVHTENGEQFLALTYERVKAASDLAFHVESSDDLIHWDAASTVLVETEDLGNTERVTVRTEQPIDTGLRKFLRLRVELTEAP